MFSGYLTFLGLVHHPRNNLVSVKPRKHIPTLHLQNRSSTLDIFANHLLARRLRNHVRYGLCVRTVIKISISTTRISLPPPPPPQNSPRQKRRNTHIHHPQPLDPQNPEIDIHTRVRIVGVSHGDSGAGMPHTRRRAADIFLYTYRCQQAHSTAASP